MARKKSDHSLQDLPEDVRRAVKIVQKIQKANKIDDLIEVKLEVSDPPRWLVISGDKVVYDSLDPEHVGNEKIVAISRPKKDKVISDEDSFSGSELFGYFSVFGEKVASVWNRREAILKSSWEKIYKKPQNYPSFLTFLYLITAIFLVSIPSYFVYQERWLDNSAILSNFYDRWVASEWTEYFVFPTYFYIILIALIELLVLQLLFYFKHPDINDVLQKPDVAEKPLKGKQEPKKNRRFLLISLFLLGLILLQNYFDVKLGVMYGVGLLGIAVVWFYIEFPKSDIQAWWQDNKGWLVPAIIFHLTLMHLLSKIYTMESFPWLAVIYMLLGGLIVYRAPKTIPVIYWVFSVALVLYTVNINAWNFSVIGDEFSFLRAAVRISEEFAWLVDIDQHLFRGDYIYEIHPFISSFLMAIPVRIFGVSNFSWTITELYLSALSIFFFFDFFKFFMKRSYAMTASILLAASHYIMAFGKVGYNNLQAFFVLSLVLWATARAIKSQKYFFFVLVGLFQALCFYIFPGALYVAPLPFLLLLIYLPPIKRVRLQQWGLIIFVFVLAIFPLILQENHWVTLLEGTLYNSPGLIETELIVRKHFISNFVYALLSPLFLLKESHYTVVGYMDVVSAAFAFLGFSYFLFNVWRNRFSVFILISYIYLIFVLGTTHDYQFPPNTRMFLLLPWFVLFAVFGLYWLLDQIRQFGFTKSFLQWVLVGIMVYLVGLNFYQANTLAKERSTGNYGTLSLILEKYYRLSNQSDIKDTDLVIVYNIESTRLHAPTILELLELYPVGFEENNLIMLDVSTMEDVEIMAGLRNENAMVIVEDQLTPEQIEIYTRALYVLGRSECSVKVGEQLRFTYWHTDEYDWLCRP